MTPEQRALREAVADAIAKAWDDEGGIIKGADAAIAVVLERAAEMLEKEAKKQIDDSEWRGYLSAALDVRALIPASSAAPSRKDG